MANPRRPYFLFNHQIKRKAPGQNTSTAVTVPVISRALESTGLALGLELATEEQLKRVQGGVVYFRRGSSYADRCLVVYKEQVQGGEKLRTLSLPIPRFAPTYKVLAVVQAANAGRGALAGKIIGVKRHGFLFPLPGQQREQR